ncbi:MAG: DUF1704 domain-containing protein [Deltaproteobacteria bacterium]|nr:DUF1704 domain-containing protein [Deltaproteobacteria bacterium]
MTLDEDDADELPAPVVERRAPARGIDEFVAIVEDRITTGKPVRRTLAGGGRLHVDRPVPFLCVYRKPTDRTDLGTAGLVRTQASYLIAPGDPEHAADTGRLVAGVVEALATACGACLVLELWSGNDAAPMAPPTFRVYTTHGDRLATTIDALVQALQTMTSPTIALAVEVIAADALSPTGQPPLLDARLAARSGVLVVGLEVPPVYRCKDAVYPFVLRALSRDLMHALQQGFFEFTRVQTAARPEHFQMMGRRRLVQAVRESDHALAEISASFDFLLAVTPVNSEAAWQEFKQGGHAQAPTLRYRMLTLDPELGKRRLYDLPLDRLEDPVLAQLLRDKRRELDRQLGLLEDRDTPRFLFGSLQLYDPVDDALLAEALTILKTLPPSGGRSRDREVARCDATTVAARAELELAHYRQHLPSLAAKIYIREDVASLLVSHGNLLIPTRLDVPAHRVDALLQHEVGTHVVTYANGASQPLRILAAGLANYEALQEGLAMFAEHLAGGLDGERLRLIAARVVAVRRLVEGVGFPAVFAELTDEHRLTARAAFTVTLRVFRGGGLTKDAIYLRGLLQVLEHLRQGHELDAMLVGKLAFEQIALVEELLRREVLHRPPLRPRWLDSEAAIVRLTHARTGLRPLDLVTELRSTV